MRQLLFTLLLLVPLLSDAQECVEGDCKNGYGTYVIYTGEELNELYLGFFKDETFNGQGLFFYSDGTTYDGEWKDGMRHGQGSYNWLDGHKYVGEWKDDKEHGQGTLTLESTGTYVGEWKDGKMHGQGTFTWQDGKKYVGGFKDGNQNGQGTTTLPNGLKYVGGYKDGEMHGQGTMINPEEKKQSSGVWENGVFLYAIETLGEKIQMIKQPDGTYTIPCEVNGLPLSFIFDTGASDVVLSLIEALFMFRQGYLKESDIIGTENYSIANGDIIEGTTINIRQLKIGDILLENIKATIVDETEAPLLLGQSAISELGTIQINPETNILTIVR